MILDPKDDWHEETQSRLATSTIYSILQLKAGTDPAGRQVLSLIDDATNYAYQRTKLVMSHMREFTLHDGEHLFRVLKLMEHVVPQNTIEMLSVPELMLLILTAFFHDIGMAPSDREVKAWQGLWEGSGPSEWEAKEYDRFRRFSEARPDRLEEIHRLNISGMHQKANLVEEYLISEYIRSTHADRAQTILDDEWRGKIKYRDTDLTSELAQLCFSHIEDPLSLLDLDTTLLCAPGVFACLPFVGAILRLCDILDFDAKRTPDVLFSHLGVKNSVSLEEWMKHRSINAWYISPHSIMFQAKCEHPAVEATIHRFCDLIDRELIACSSIFSHLSHDRVRNNTSHYCIIIPPKVDRSKIGSKTDVFGKPVYQYRDIQFTLSKGQVIDLLMGTKLYGKPEVALRELLQNSIDACMVRHALEESWGNQYHAEISVQFKKENDESVLVVTDNGIGMDEYIIDNYYSKVGSSFYRSTDFYELKSQFGLNFMPISRFGIGVLSYFMVSDSITIDTRRLRDVHDSSNPIEVVVEGRESIFCIREGRRKHPGTTTELRLRKDNPWEYMTWDKFRDLVAQQIPNPPFPVEIKHLNHHYVHSSDSFLNTKSELYVDFLWPNHKYVRQFELDISDSDLGITGTATVGILEKNQMPSQEVQAFSKEVSILGTHETFDLKTLLTVGHNEIRKSVDSIEIDDEGNTEVNSGKHNIMGSKSRLSSHGVQIPMSLFPSFWDARDQLARLEWPFPSLVVVDLNGNRDVDLNSARTQVTYNEKWIDFAETLAFVVCREVSQKVCTEYWNKLREIWRITCNNENFLRGLDRAHAIQEGL